MHKWNPVIEVYIQLLAQKRIVYSSENLTTEFCVTYQWLVAMPMTNVINNSTLYCLVSNPLQYVTVAFVHCFIIFNSYVRNLKVYFVLQKFVSDWCVQNNSWSYELSFFIWRLSPIKSNSLKQVAKFNLYDTLLTNT